MPTDDQRVPTLIHAVAVLNHFRHRGCGKWYAHGSLATPGVGDSLDDLTEFEAVAIAERYLVIQGLLNARLPILSALGRNR